MFLILIFFGFMVVSTAMSNDAPSSSSWKQERDVYLVKVASSFCNIPRIPVNNFKEKGSGYLKKFKLKQLTEPILITNLTDDFCDADCYRTFSDREIFLDLFGKLQISSGDPKYPKYFYSLLF
jgi:hypothetical protein